MECRLAIITNNICLSCNKRIWWSMKGFFLTTSLLRISLGAMIFMSLIFPHGSASLKRIDNNHCLEDEVTYECNSSTNFNWKFTIGNEIKILSFINRWEGYSVSNTIKTVNLTAITTQRSNTTTRSIFTFLASQELHGGMMRCDGESKHFYLDGK